MITDAAGGGIWIGPDGKTYGEWYAISSKHVLVLAGCMVTQYMMDPRGQIMLYRVPSWLYDAEEDRRMRELLETRK